MELLAHNTVVVSQPVLPNRFIFGDAVHEEALENTEYLIHTVAPMFICRLMWEDNTNFPGSEQKDFASALLYDSPDSELIYVCNLQLKLFDFYFIQTEQTVTAGELKLICDEAVHEYQRLRDAYAMEQAGENARRMLQIPRLDLPLAEWNQAVSQLTQLAETAAPYHTPLLNTIRQTASAGDFSVFTEAQLTAQAEARLALIRHARHLIAHPEVPTDDGQPAAEFDLWALPFTFLRAQGGMWWHYPKLKQLEQVLQSMLELSDSAALWLSPTWFTVDMLNDSCCQSVIHLVSAMQSGYDLAPYDPVRSRTEYETASASLNPQTILAWIPFLVKRASLSQTQVARVASDPLDQSMPILQEAVLDEMEYGEAELFMPMPWWEAVYTAVARWNRKRLSRSL